MQRTAVIAGALALLACGCVLIVAAGHGLRSREAPPAAPQDVTAAVGGEGMDTSAMPPAAGDGGAASEAQEPAEKMAATGSADEPPLERVAPRGALSELGQALPAKPKPPGEWKGTLLPRPVATAAGLVEAKGYRVAVAGIDPLPADEICSYQGRDWPCGVRARAAFRAFLRGRAISCVVPPQADPDIVTAACMVGKIDVAEWLAGNGWAQARADGDYAALGDTARAAGKGIFGPPPATTAPSSVIRASELPAPPEGAGSILVLPPADAFGQDAPAAPAIGPDEVFPTPPAPPPAPAQ